MSEQELFEQSQRSPSAESSSPGGASRFAPVEIAGISSPMVGREAELQQLIGELYAVLEGGPARMVTVVGPAGIGKSRLVHELRMVIAKLPEPVTVLTLQADRQSTAQPFSLIRMLIAALFRIGASNSPATVRAQLEQGVAGLLGAGSEGQAQFIGQLAGFDLGASPLPRGHGGEPRQIRDRALLYLRQCLEASAAQTPLVLTFDDFHDADDGSIDAIAQLLGTGGNLALLLICLAQQRLYERRPEWDQGGRHIRIDLRPLEEREGRRLVAEILRKAGKLPADLRNLIVSRAEGNPFYVEELIKMLIADGVIVPGEPTWSVQQTRLSRLRVPATLSELLRSRIQALAFAERELLLRAAVVGRIFWAEAADALCNRPGRPNDELAALYAEMEQKELITPLPESRLPGQHEYSFRHELLHEVAYLLLPAELRKPYHCQVADWLVAKSGDRGDTYAGLVAEQYERGGQLAEAARWHARAGNYARETHAVESAIQHYQTALRLCADSPATTSERIACLGGLGEVQLEAARLNEAEASYKRMAELAEAAGDRATAARAWNGLAYVQDNALAYGASKASALRGVALAEGAEAPGELAQALWHLAWAEVRGDNTRLALEIGQRALAILEQLADPAATARWSGLLGVIHDLLGDTEKAIRFQHEALDYYRSVGNLTETATQLNNLAATCNQQGDYTGALRYLEEAQRISHAAGSRIVELYVLSNLATVQNGMGDHAAAEETARRGIALSEMSRGPIFCDYYRAVSAACLHQGRVTEAVEAAHQALEMARANEGPREVAGAWRSLGQAIGAMSDSQGAPRCFEESLRLFTSSGAYADLGRTLRAWAEYELRSGDAALGRELWQRARTLFSEHGVAHELARTAELPPEVELTP